MSKPPNKTALRAFAQNELKERVTCGRPRSYEIYVYEDMAAWKDGVSDQETLYGPGGYLTKPEAWKQIAPNQVLDVFVYSRGFEEYDTELDDTITIDLAEINNPEYKPKKDVWPVL